MSTSPRLVCLGNFTLDDVVLPDGTERLLCTGGDALYATLAARLSEPRSELVAPIGHDFPSCVRDQMRQAGLDDSGLIRRNLPTLHNRIEYFRDGSRKWTLYSNEEDFDELSPRSTDIPQSYRSAEAFLILAMTLPAQQELVAGLRPGTATVALDPQEDYIFGNETNIQTMVSGVDVFLPSAEEVQRLLGHNDWSVAARTFAALGPPVIVIKLGENGCLVYDRARDHEIRLPAFPGVSVVDTTGAGDSFCGAFMATYLDDPGRPERAAKAGAVAASFTVSGYGVDPLFAVSPEESARRLRDWDL